MAIVRSCDPGDGAVALETSAGEFLEYKIPAASDGVLYVLTDGAGTHILDDGSCPPPCTRRWPSAGGEAPGSEDTTHVLAVQFLGRGELSYEVTRKAADGSTVAVVKKCTFSQDDGPDEYFEALRIFLS